MALNTTKEMQEGIDNFRNSLFNESFRKDLQRDFDLLIERILSTDEKQKPTSEEQAREILKETPGMGIYDIYSEIILDENGR